MRPSSRSRVVRCLVSFVDRFSPPLVSYGGSLRYALVFAQTFRVTGGPVLREAHAQLRDSYGRTREAVKLAAPDVATAARAVERFEQRAPALQASVRAVQCEAAALAADAERLAREQRGAIADARKVRVESNVSSSIASIQGSKHPPPCSRARTRSKRAHHPSRRARRARGGGESGVARARHVRPTLAPGTREGRAARGGGVGRRRRQGAR